MTELSLWLLLVHQMPWSTSECSPSCPWRHLEASFLLCALPVIECVPVTELHCLQAEKQWCTTWPNVYIFKQVVSIIWQCPTFLRNGTCLSSPDITSLWCVNMVLGYQWTKQLTKFLNSRFVKTSSPGITFGFRFPYHLGAADKIHTAVFYWQTF